MAAHGRRAAMCIFGVEERFVSFWNLGTIDRINDWVGRVVSILVMVIIGITLWEVVLRYGFNRPTIWVHETSEHLFAISFLLGGAYTLSKGGHVRVDVLYVRMSPRKRAALDIYTSVFFFIFTGLLLYLGMGMAWESVAMLERSQTPWGPYIFHVILMVPVAAFLMLLQGIAQLIRDWRIYKERGQ